MTPSSTNAGSLADYFAALKRLADGKPRVVTKGARITNDAVSVEAGRGKGSIKKSRAVFADLIAAIEEAATVQASPKRHDRMKLNRAQSEAKQYREELEAALARELSLIKDLYETKKRLAAISGADVLPLRRRTTARENK